ncbi:hypothetical protein [Stratiformator vulcanicus]|uniref:HicB-like antitoxin of toxin-antitoxin system domain-containing protein n=1 Tax=Stratiformator vulcanicus TaxID=2527980 RepID=A0A517R1N9_9PLAN|nr:hypothetical protein [Stratiformator vulcanicus]QDT37815.1 hypothetical protein Pan189_21970 [Stratiformator vulcanicus]
MSVQLRVRPVHYGVGYVAAFEGDPGSEVHAASFNDAVGQLLTRIPDFADPDGAPPRLSELDVTVVDDQFGQFLLQIDQT